VHFIPIDIFIELKICTNDTKTEIYAVRTKKHNSENIAVGIFTTYYKCVLPEVSNELIGFVKSSLDFWEVD
jgi:hypothetical protein